MYVYLNFMLILNQRLNFVLVYCIYHIHYLWKHFFIALAAYWSPFGFQVNSPAENSPVVSSAYFAYVAINNQP